MNTSAEREREAKRAFFLEPQRANRNIGEGILFLRKTYQALDERLTPTAFSLYAFAEQKRDEEEARRRKREVRFTGDDEAEALELFLITEIERSNWFGALTFRTTYYDDLRGVDAVLEWDEADRFGFIPRLAVDVSGSPSASRNQEKLKKALQGVDIKYFRSQVELDDDEPKDMSLQNVPIVTLGIDADLVEGIGQYALLHQKKTSLVSRVHHVPEVKEYLDPKTFAQHPLKDLLHEQAMVQINAQIRIEADRLVQWMQQIHSCPPICSKVITDYEKLIEQQHVSAGEIIRLMKPLEAWLQTRRTNVMIDRWQNLCAVHALITEQMTDNKKTASLISRWKDASVTHGQLTRQAA